MILVKNFRFLYCSFLSKIDWEIVRGNVVIENKPFQTTDYMDFTCSPNWVFPTGLARDFGQCGCF